MTTATAVHTVDQAKVTFSQATALVVKSPSARQLATDLFDAIRAFRKQSEADKETTCRPLKDEWEKAKKPFDDFKKECEGHEEALARKMGEWDREQERLAREEQAKIQAKIDEQNARRIEKAEAKGVEPILRTAPVVPMPERTVSTQAGTTQTRVVRKVYGVKGVQDGTELKANDPRIKDLVSAFPALCVFDWVAFRKLASTGMLDQCAQVEQREEYTYVQRSKGK